MARIYDENLCDITEEVNKATYFVYKLVALIAVISIGVYCG